MPLESVPIIDLAPYRTGVEMSKRAVAEDIGEACRDIGFLGIAGHGVPQQLIDAVDEVSRAFFDLPPEERINRVGYRYTRRRVLGWTCP